MEPAGSKAQRFEPEDHLLQRKTPNMVAQYSFPCETRTRTVSSGSCSLAIVLVLRRPPSNGAMPVAGSRRDDSPRTGPGRGAGAELADER